MMKKKAMGFVVAVVLVLCMALSVALAVDHYNASSFTVNNREFTVRCWISEDRMRAGAWTTGGTNTYNRVWAVYYWSDPVTQESDTIPDYLYSAISASVSSSSLEGTGRHYWKVVSDHKGEYGGASDTLYNLTVTYGN